MLNSAHTSGTDGYYTRQRPSITSLVCPGQNHILDLGCGSGAVGRSLLDSRKAGRLVGVEIFETAAAEARKFYDQVFTGDIEQMDLPFDGSFDYVLCGDILEHLKDPYTLVRRINSWLKPGGFLICSLPNVRHWKVVADLTFRGHWNYADSGVMDKTHLRFFTRSSGVQMLRDAQFEVESCRILYWGRKYKIFDALSLGLFREFLGPQMVMRARKNEPFLPPKS